MIRMLQCLCPERHCILAIQYDTSNLSPEDAKDGFKALIEMQVDHGILNKRCEICDKKVAEFLFEDAPTREQDWEKARAITEQLEADQLATRSAVMAERKAAKN